MRVTILSLVLMLCLFAGGVAFAQAVPEDLPLPETTAGPQGMHSVSDGGMLDEGGLLYLVNRDKKAGASYEPDDLVVPNVPTRKKGMEDGIMLREEAARALEQMFAAAKREGKHILYAVSGYRSYGIQQILFNGKVSESGRERALRTVAPPGTSEHQLGLAMDVQSLSFLQLNETFADTEEGKWVEGNAHRFGFVIRYKEEWREITGYAYEPWHLRYLGKAHAQAVHALDIPYEHYYAVIKDLPGYVLAGATDVLLEGLARGQLQDNPQPLPQDMLSAITIEEQEAALRAATIPYLPEGTGYEQALWRIYPTPKPTAGPRVDEDEETSLFSLAGHAVAP